MDCTCLPALARQLGSAVGGGCLSVSWRQQPNALSVCMLACLGERECHDIWCLSFLIRGWGECHSFPFKQILPRENSAIAHTCLPQQMQWLLMPAQPSPPVKVVEECSLQACTPVLAGGMESAMASPALSFLAIISTVSCLSNWCPLFIKENSLTFSLGTFQTVIFVLFSTGSWGQKNYTWALYKRGIPISYGTLGLPHISPIGYPSQMFHRLIFLAQIPEAKVPDVGHQSLTLLEERTVQGDSFLLCVTIAGVGGGGGTFLNLCLPLFPFLVWFFYPLFW